MQEHTHGRITTAAVVLEGVVRIHAQEAAGLQDTRTALVRAPQVNLLTLHRADDRLAAHLDGLAVAGEQAWPFCEALLETPFSGAAFVAAVRAIDDQHEERLDRLFVLAEAAPEARRGLISAFGWLERTQLRGVVAELIKTRDGLKRTVGLSACAMHRVDPQGALTDWLADPNPKFRARALRAAGELGRQDLRAPCAATIVDEDPDCQFWGGWSAVLLGNRDRALEAVRAMGHAPGPHRARAFRLALHAMSASDAEGLLRELAREPANLRWVIQGSGIIGNPGHVPWLIGHMNKPETARMAGEAFTLITGADLDALQLWRAQPEDFESGPSEDPNDENVEMDPDEGLMWPDHEKVQEWWVANGSRFQKGTRYFMGAPVTREQCTGVLKNGYQRQRILAAHHLCLLEPGTPLFNTSAPAWRQQRLLVGKT